MQYDKNQIYFTNEQNTLIKNNVIKNYSNNVNVTPAVISNKIKEEFLYVAGIVFVLIILKNKQFNTIIGLKQIKYIYSNGQN